MNIAEAAANQNSPLNAALLAGLESLDRNDSITFTKYTRAVLPLDGYIFWLNAGQTMTVSGSVHYSTERLQNDDETFDKNQVVFTAESDIDTFNDITPNILWIGSYDGIRFAFSRRSPLYKVAGIYHYIGDAIYPAMESQIIDNPNDFDNVSLIVSDSLPIWLSLNQYMPIYPAMLSQQNIDPVYAVVDIDAHSQTPLQAMPYQDYLSNHWQLVQETVKFTIYGLRNDTAIDFQDYLIAASMGETFGLIDSPIIKDVKRNQSELSVIAMKKTLEMTISYYQQRARNIAQKLIQSAALSVIASASAP